MRWAEPGWFLLLILVPLPWFFERARPRMSWPTLGGFKGTRAFWTMLKRQLPIVARAAAIACIAVALARPQTVGGRTRIAGQGVAIVVALDHSSSMKAVDFASRANASAVSRLDAAKETFARFVSGRPDDLIGLVVFANYPDPACPTTLDHARLLETVRGLRQARPGDDGTNLGDATILGLGLLREASPKKKVLILLTDGHNSPAVPRPTDPELAARLARELGITLHTIAIGQGEGILRGVEPVTGLDLVAQVDAPDFELLKRLAKLGGGQAFAASDVGTLDQVFKKIDDLEKSPVQSMILTRYREHFAPWAAASLILLALDRFLVSSRLRILP